MKRFFIPALLILIASIISCQERMNNEITESNIIHLMKKKIYVDQSKVLLKIDQFAQEELDEWDIHHSEWWVEDGWLYGKNPRNHPGMIILKKDFPGKVYKIQAGSVDGHCFILADGQLLLEGMDPDPIDNQKYTKVGLEAYSSFIKVKNITVRQIH